MLGRARFVVWNEFGDHSANSAADLNGCVLALLLHSCVINATMAAPTFGWWMCSLGPGKNTPSSWRTVAGQFSLGPQGTPPGGAVSVAPLYGV